MGNDEGAGMRLWTWATYEDIVLERAARLLDRRPEGSAGLRLRAPSLEQGLIGLGLAALWGLELILDEKSRDPRREEHVWDLPLEELWEAADPQAIELRPSAPGTPSKLSFASLEVSFSTSGSTGRFQFVKKHAAGMLTEVDALQGILGVKAGQRILSFVRPFHIYGFLHAFLLPWRAGCPVIYWPTQTLMPDLMELPPHPDLVVAVPAHWSLIRYLLEKGGLRTLVSSGASFGRPRRELLQAHRGAYERGFEILGSTETGGIGYRSLDGAEEDYKFFPGVSLLSSDDSGSRLLSRFVAPESEVFTFDRIEACGDGSFRHHGRADRVFKYGGKRFSLVAIEQALSELCGGAAVSCHFQEDGDRAQGGILKAWIEGEETEDSSHLKSRYLRAFSLPFPRELHFIPRFPRDAQGKLQLPIS